MIFGEAPIPSLGRTVQGMESMMAEGIIVPMMRKSMMIDMGMELCLEQPYHKACKNLALPMAQMEHNLAPPVVDVERQANSLWTHLVIFAGIFELLRSAVGLYASWHEQVAFARLYMRSWLVIIALASLSSAKDLASPLERIFLCVRLPFLGLLLYFAMVAWSFYQQLQNRNQGSASDGEVAPGRIHAEIKRA